MNNNSISVVFADSSHAHYAQRICDLIYESALQRGTGIAKRSPEYIAAKMTGGKAVVALDGEKLIGFSYIECWGHGDFVATSGLIVDPEYRHMGLAEEFWRGCQGCCNYDILQRNNRRMCLCTGMLYDPAKEPPQVQSRMAPYIMFFKNKFKKLFHLK